MAAAWAEWWAVWWVAGKAVWKERMLAARWAGEWERTRAGHWAAMKVAVMAEPRVGTWVGCSGIQRAVAMADCLAV